MDITDKQIIPWRLQMQINTLKDITDAYKQMNTSMDITDTYKQINTLKDITDA